MRLTRGRTERPREPSLQLGIGRFRWYTPAQLQAVIAESTALPEEPRRPLLRSRPLEAAEILAAALPLLG